MAAALLALARPQAVLLLPSRLDSVMLAIDTSGSMRATDVLPNRLEAALAAVRIFIEEQPVQVKVGIVNLSGTASVAQAPTTQRDELFRAIENLPLQRGSALGSGIVVALANLLPGSGIDPEKIIMEAEPWSLLGMPRTKSSSHRGPTNPWPSCSSPMGKAISAQMC